MISNWNRDASQTQNPLGLRTFGVPPSKITNFLWLGNLYDAMDERFVVDNIDEVILVGGWHPPQMFPGIAYVHYPLPQPFGKMLPRAESVVERLKTNHKRHTATLLVCAEGIDRGPTLALKFLKENGLVPNRPTSWKQAVALIKKHRPIAVPHRDWWPP